MRKRHRRPVRVNGAKRRIASLVPSVGQQQQALREEPQRPSPTPAPAAPGFAERELHELYVYVVSKLEALERSDGRAAMSASLAIISFTAEHGPEKTMAMTRELDRRYFKARFGVEPIVKKDH